jgi:hypothetical protein
MAYAFAAILRFLTPFGKQSIEANQRDIYVGWLDGHTIGGEIDTTTSADETVTYADGLRYNLSEGWYEFRCSCGIEWSSSSKYKHCTREVPLPVALYMVGRGRQPSAYMDVIRSYLLNSQGGDLKSLLIGESIHEESLRAVILETFVAAISTLYARMVSGDSVVDILNEMLEMKHVYTNGLATSCEVLVDGPLSVHNVTDEPMHFCKCSIPDWSCLMKEAVKADDIAYTVLSEVRGQHVIDLHTHLLPPSHGGLCSWGIDELLTYHYLVAEYFMTAPPTITPESFYALSKAKQVCEY